MDFIIWRDVPVEVRIKGFCISKLGKRLRRRFHVEFGSIPVLRFNEKTKEFEAIYNFRGNAYALRLSRKAIISKGKRKRRCDWRRGAIEN